MPCFSPEPPISHRRMVIAASALLSVLAAARPADLFLERSFSTPAMTMPYRLFVPKNYDPSRQYPLVLTFHGMAENGSDNKIQVHNQWRLAEVWAEDSNQVNNPCFVLSPQCPKDNQWVNVSFIRTGSYDYDTVPISKPLQAAVALLDSVMQTYSIDRSRLYVTGVSMGGYASWYLAIKYPNRFAAVLPMSGASDPGMAAVIGQTPIWAYHGALDEIVLVKNSREMMGALKRAGRACVYTHCVAGDSSRRMSNRQIDSAVSAGARLLYSEWPSIGHWGYENLYDHPSLVRWTFKQRLGSSPESVGGSRGGLGRDPTRGGPGR